MAEQKRLSVLAERIAAGKADPISPQEREIVAGLRAYHAKKYGSGKTSRVLGTGTSAGKRGIAKSSNA